MERERQRKYQWRRKRNNGGNTNNGNTNNGTATTAIPNNGNGNIRRIRTRIRMGTSSQKPNTVRQSLRLRRTRCSAKNDNDRTREFSIVTLLPTSVSRLSSPCRSADAPLGGLPTAGVRYDFFQSARDSLTPSRRTSAANDLALQGGVSLPNNLNQYGPEQTQWQRSMGITQWQFQRNGNGNGNGKWGIPMANG